MIEALDAIVAGLGGPDRLSASLSILALLVARIAPLAVLAPYAGARGLPGPARAGIAAVIAFSLAPVALETAAAPVGAFGFGLAMMREILVGSVFALASGLPFHALDFAGRLSDTLRGASLAEVIAPWSEERTSPLGDLYALSGIAAFFALGGHRLVLRGLADGLVAAPIGAEVADFAAMAHGSIALTSSALAFAVSLAAPVLCAVVLAEVSMGVLARTAPQVPVFFAAMPLRAALGIAAATMVIAYLARDATALASGVEAARALVRDMSSR